MAITKFVLVLTDEAQANPERFVPLLEQTLGDRGCRNFTYLATVGVVNVDFDVPNPNLNHLPGVLAVEPDTGAVALGDDGLVTHESKQTPEEVAAYWTPERMADAKPVPMPGVNHPLAVSDQDGNVVGTFGKW